MKSFYSFVLEKKSPRLSTKLKSPLKSKVFKLAQAKKRGKETGRSHWTQDLSNKTKTLSFDEKVRA